MIGIIIPFQLIPKNSNFLVVINSIPQYALWTIWINNFLKIPQGRIQTLFSHRAIKGPASPISTVTASMTQKYLKSTCIWAAKRIRRVFRKDFRCLQLQISVQWPLTWKSAQSTSCDRAEVSSNISSDRKCSRP